MAQQLLRLVALLLFLAVALARNCELNTPFSDEYWTEDLAYDNVLIGDYQHVDPYNNSAVYGRYLPAHAKKLDGRQPLPSVFAARWNDDGQSRTDLKIWREGRSGRQVTCTGVYTRCGPNVQEIVTFDDAENAFGDVPMSRVGLCMYLHWPELDLPMTSRTNVRNPIYPALTNGAVRGWLYLNFDYSIHDSPEASGNWVISSISNQGRHSIDVDAAALGNGCTLETPSSEVTTGTHIIGPLWNKNS